jgi:hypothetical protein
MKTWRLELSGRDLFTVSGTYADAMASRDSMAQWLGVHYMAIRIIEVA